MTLPGEETEEDLRIWARVEEIDEDNLVWIKGLFAECGWPHISEVGAEIAEAVWLLVQYADNDPEFQRACLDAAEAMPPGEMAANNLARLTDRVLLKETGNQRYGSTWISINGEFVPQPLEDPDRVDALRASLGLAPMDELRAELQTQYTPPLDAE